MWEPVVLIFSICAAALVVLVLLLPHCFRYAARQERNRLLLIYVDALDAAIAEGACPASERQKLIDEYIRDVWGSVK